MDDYNPTWPEALSDVLGCFLQIAFIIVALKAIKFLWGWL